MMNDGPFSHRPEKREKGFHVIVPFSRAAYRTISGIKGFGDSGSYFTKVIGISG